MSTFCKSGYPPLTKPPLILSQVYRTEMLMNKAKEDHQSSNTPAMLYSPRVKHMSVMFSLTVSSIMFRLVCSECLLLLQ